MVLFVLLGVLVRVSDYGVKYIRLPGPFCEDGKPVSALIRQKLVHLRAGTM